MAGIPVIVTNLPDMAKMIETYGGGWTIEPNANALADLVGQLDREKVNSVAAISKPFPTWDDAKAVLVDAVCKTLRT